MLSVLLTIDGSDKDERAVMRASVGRLATHPRIVGLKDSAISGIEQFLHFRGPTFCVLAGSANFLSRLTAAMAAVFFVSTLALAFVSNEGQGTGSVMEGVSTPASSVPAVPGSTPNSSVPPASTVPPAPASGGAGSSGVPGGGSGNAPAAGSGAADQIPK